MPKMYILNPVQPLDLTVSKKHSVWRNKLNDTMRNNQANLGCRMFMKRLSWSPQNPYQEKKRSTKTVIDFKRIQTTTKCKA